MLRVKEPILFKPVCDVCRKPIKHIEIACLTLVWVVVRESGYWEIAHNRCSKNNTRPYYIPLTLLQTPADAIHWSSHLCNSTYLSDNLWVSWHAALYRLFKNLPPTAMQHQQWNEPMYSAAGRAAQGGAT